MMKNAFEAIAGRKTGQSGGGQNSGNCPLLLLCDHASNALPEGGLGLDPGLLATHIAYDIGAAAVTRALAAAYGAPALLGGWSRLLIDLNRGADDPTLVMKLSDGSIIPGNRDADAAEVARRIAAWHAPYHAAIAAELDRMGQETNKPARLSRCIVSRPPGKAGRGPGTWACCMTATHACPRR